MPGPALIEQIRSEIALASKSVDEHLGPVESQLVTTRGGNQRDSVENPQRPASSNDHSSPGTSSNGSQTGSADA